MKKVKRFLLNIIGIILFGIVIVLLCELFDFLAPKLIDEGWKSYLLIGFTMGIVMTLIAILQTLIFFPFYYTITSFFSKITCTILATCGFLYSIITPWQFSNAIGFNLIVIVWFLTLTVFIFTTFLFLSISLYIKKEK